MSDAQSPPSSWRHGIDLNGVKLADLARAVGNAITALDARH